MYLGIFRENICIFLTEKRHELKSFRCLIVKFGAASADQSQSLFSRPRFSFFSIFSISLEVATTWDSKTLDHRPVRISIGREQNGSLPITITGPLFNSPPAPSAPKGNVPGLWNYEGIIILSGGHELVPRSFSRRHRGTLLDFTCKIRSFSIRAYSGRNLLPGRIRKIS